VVRAGDDALHVAKLAVNAPLPRAVYVVDEDDRLLGTITDGELARRIFEGINPSLYFDSHRHGGTHFLRRQESVTEMTAQELISETEQWISDTDTLNQAMSQLYISRVDELPVVNQAGQLVGVIRALDILREWAEDALLLEFGDETESFF
jgi:CBS-domain-containing membrane protein